MLLVSCASLNSIDTKSNNYIGRLLFGYKDDFASFNVNINLSKNSSIIQVKKPFYGNVLNISAHRDQHILINPLKYAESIKVPSYINKNFHEWLINCLLKEKFEILEIENDFSYRLACNKNGDKTFYKIKFQEYALEGYIIKKK